MDQPTAPRCPVCGSPVEFQTVIAENRFGDRRQAHVASCTGCELISEHDRSYTPKGAK